MIIEIIPVGSLQSNCYVLAAKDKSEAVIIDPGEEENKIRKVLEKHNLRTAAVVNTHGHYDHIACDDNFGVPIYAHAEDVALLKDPQLNMSNFLGLSFRVKSEVHSLKDKETLKVGSIELEVIHTPGHTPGGICLLLKAPENKVLFSGDSLFYRSIGRTDFPGASEEQLISSIKERLLKLPDETVVYPGHGGQTTIGYERKHNSFLA